MESAQESEGGWRGNEEQEVEQGRTGHEGRQRKWRTRNKGEREGNGTRKKRK